MSKVIRLLPGEKIVNKIQLAGEISEKNEYRNLLGICISVFNFLPNRKTHLSCEDNSTTYKLIKKIENTFEKYD